ncbi:Diacylglycerol kinase epsilon [Hypsibius exemplaris]|uniref:Diacylglycerol kinase n=1 Tax=Hypsibius exemplaris TaxID=2072580 RepID=A0A1W0X978_HYPEX|nr:Diacylglycerol kinase epsilon [Hypsibius exemplaris]
MAADSRLGSHISSWDVWSDFIDPFELGVCALIAVGVFVFVKLRGGSAAEHIHLPLREFNKGHSFSPTDLFAYPSYCNICEENVVEGFRCDACGTVTHAVKCAQVAHAQIRCKALSSFGPIMKHHTIKGNLPLNSMCCVCFKECGHAPRLCDFRCVWCKRTLHEDCLPQLPEECDLGPHKQFIIPPNGVKVKLVGIRPRRQTVVNSVRPPEAADWTPLIVIGNRKSGSGDSAAIMSTFRRVLNPGQVIDVNSVKPEEVLDWINLLPEYTCRILVCGGDGTVGWILNTIEKLKLNPRPAVAILPIGTGNDLSNVLGWGATVALPIDIDALFDRIARAKPCKVDRWAVEVRTYTRIGIPLSPPKSFISNNYCSMGVDALVTLNFHRKREQIPKFFASRYMNKFLYFSYGTMDVLERACYNLNEKVSLECDGKAIELPTMEGIVFLNIPSWGAGVDVWNLNRGAALPQEIDDGYFEVFALYSSFHIAQMQVGLSTPHRLCRAKSATLTLHKSNVPMQVDGEPWEQGPGVIRIKFDNQALLLSAKGL